MAVVYTDQHKLLNEIVNDEWYVGRIYNQDRRIQIPVQEMIDWCRATFGIMYGPKDFNTFTIIGVWYHVSLMSLEYFCFKNEQDLGLFLLKFGEHVTNNYRLSK